MTEQEILDCARTLATSTAHPAWPAFVEAMTKCQYGWDAIVNAWAWFQDGFMKGRPAVASHEIQCCACAAVIALKPTVEANGAVEANGVADCEGCGAHLAWFIPFAAELTGGVIRVEVLQIPEPGPSEEEVAALIKEGLDPSRPRVHLVRDEVAARIRSLPNTGHSSAPHNEDCKTMPALHKDVNEWRFDGESPVAAVTRVLTLEHGITPSNVLVMQLINAVRDTTPPSREVTIGMLSKILRSLAPAEAVNAWAERSARQIVSILTKHPEVQRVAELIDDERIWCTLEGTIAGMLLRVCRGQDLSVLDKATGHQVPDLRR